MKRLVLIVLILCLVPGILFGQIWEQHVVPAGGQIEAIDWDRDGDVDLAGYGGVVFNNLPDDWQLEPFILPDIWATDSESADFNYDGELDWVFYQGGVTYGALGWIENLGDFEFEAHIIQEFDQGHGGVDISAGDIEGDGDIDIVISCTSPGGDIGLTSFVQQPGGQWTTIELWSRIADHPSRLADLDGDGFLDFVVMQNAQLADTSNGGLTAYFGTVTGDFDRVHVRFAEDGYCEPDLMDFDHDGDLDILTFHPFDEINVYYPTEIHWWENHGDRTFTGHLVESWLTGDGGERPVIGVDIDNDGDTDIATLRKFIGSPPPRDLCVYLNQGDDETFVLQQLGEVADIDQLVAADIDNDGDTDLLSQHVYWFENPSNDPPQFIIRLVPRQTQIPGTGGTLVFDGMAYSQFAQTGTCTVWATVTGPAGNNELLWTRQLTFTPGQWYTYPDLTQAVPAWAPQGDYTFRVRAGIPGIGTAPGDSLVFVKGE